MSFTLINFICTLINIIKHKHCNRLVSVRSVHPQYSVDIYTNKSIKNVLKLYKYIYINNYEEYQNKLSEIFVKANKDFFVYIVTLEDKESEENESDKEMNGKNEVSPKGKRIPYSGSVSDRSSTSEKFDSKSKFLIEPSKSCKSQKGTLKKQSSLQTVRTKEQNETKSKGYEFIKRFMGLQRTKRDHSSIDEIFVRDYSLDDTTKEMSISSQIGEHMNKYIIPTAFVPENNPYIDYTLAEALRETIDLTNKLQESETFVKELISRYIQDKSLEKDLVDLVTGHGKMLIESERRALNLANDTWIQQAEIYKDQHRALQNSINSVVHQNRDLQEENENLIRKYEKIYTKIALVQDASSNKTGNLSSVKIIEDLNKNNDKLRVKLNSLFGQIDDLETQLKKSHKKTDLLQKQMNSNNSQMHHTKAQLQRTKADHELEVTKLTNELQMNRLMIRECVEAGDVLLDDLDALKAQMKHLSKTINWDKFKRRGKSIVDLLHLSRSCINELTREVTNKDNEIQLQLQENEMLRDDLFKKQEVVGDFDKEKAKLQQKILEHNQIEIDFKVLKEKYSELENKLVKSEQLVERKNYEIHARDTNIREYDEHIQKLICVISEKGEIVNRFQTKMETVIQEKDACIVQINGLAQVLAATGTGDIAKELATSQEKISDLQEKYFSEISEKKSLLKQIEDNNSEKQTLVAYQKTYYEHLQVQHRNLETLEKNNEILKEQLDAERSTVSALQTERMRHLEEKTILKATYDRLKLEIAKIDRLEGEVSHMSKKASKLAMIAEYNKQLGEKLKEEVAEKDITINELQNNVNELNVYQVETTKEKMALCEELTQVFTIKKTLDSKLAVELQKNELLDQSRKEVETVAQTQLKEMQEMYKREHAALKSMLKDMKNVVAERDKLSEANKEFEHKISEVVMEKEKLASNLEHLKLQSNETELKIVEYQKELSDKSKECDFVRSSLEEKISFYKQSHETLKEIVDPFTKENADMKKTIEYLQAEISKTRSDFDKAKESELTYKNLLKKEANENEMMQLSLEKERMKIKELRSENSQLQEIIDNMTADFESAKLEYKLMEDNVRKYEMRLKEAAEEIDTFVNDLNVRDEEIINLQDKLREFEQHNENLRDILSEETREKEEMIKEHCRLEHELAEAIAEKQEKLKEVKSVKSNRDTDTELVSYAPLNFEETRGKFEGTADFTTKLTSIHNEETLWPTKFNDLVKEHEAAIASKSKLEKAHRALAMKMLRAVQVLICEKTLRQKNDASIKILEAERDKLKVSNDTTETKLQQKLVEIANLHNQIDDLNGAKQSDVSSRDNLGDKRNKSADMRKPTSQEKKCDLLSHETNFKETEEHLAMMRKELDDSHMEILKLQDTLSTLESDYACLEFQKSETVLRLHELQGKLQSLQGENEEMRVTIQRTLQEVLRVYEAGLITQSVYNGLLRAVRVCESQEKK